MPPKSRSPSRARESYGALSVGTDEVSEVKIAVKLTSDEEGGLSAGNAETFGQINGFLQSLARICANAHGYGATAQLKPDELN